MPPIDKRIGQRLRELRTTARPKPLTIDEFGERMRAELGNRGWHPAAVVKIEKGDQPLRLADLAAAAIVLHCTVLDIVGVAEPVRLGSDESATTVGRLDALVGGDDAMPETVAWAHFERAAEALADQRNAEERYRFEMDAVRSVTEREDEVGASMRRRVEAYARRVHDAAQAVIDEMHADDVEHARELGTEPPAGKYDVTTPATVAAQDALGNHPIPVMQWARRLSAGRR